MKPIENPSIVAKEKIEYLQSGKQTEITPKIKEIVSSFGNETLSEKTFQIIDFVKSLKYETKNKDDVFRKRTADRIISDGYVTGCTDENLVFEALARASGIPTKYIETIDIEFLRKKSGEQGSYSGHVYSGILEGDKNWSIVDVTKRKIGANIENDNRIFFKEGKDSWDIGITDFDTLKKEFDKFRENYK